MKSSEKVFSQIESAGLLSPGDLKHARERWNKPGRPDVDSASHCAKWLVTNKFLTTFQAQKILGGEGDQLRIEDFRVRDQIKDGPFAGALIASDALNRPVLIQFAKPGVANRFQEAVAKAKNLAGPHFQRVLGEGEAYSRPYVVREWWEGVTLAEALSHRGKLDSKKACTIFATVLNALSTLGESGFTLPEVSLDSIFLAVEPGRRAGRIVKLPGAGIPADLLECGANQGKSSNPEEAVHQVGRAMYLAVSGKAIQPGNQKPVPVNSLVPEIPELVGELIDQLVDPDPQTRFSDPRVAAKAMRILIASDEAESKPSHEDNLEIESVSPGQGAGSRSTKHGAERGFTEEAEGEEADWISEKAEELLAKAGITPRELVFLAGGALGTVFLLLISLWLVGDLIPVIALFLGAAGGYYLNTWLTKKETA